MPKQIAYSENARRSIEAGMNKLDDAKSEVQAGLALDPTFTTKSLTIEVATDNPVFLAALAHIVENTHNTGVPEG